MSESRKHTAHMYKIRYTVNMLIMLFKGSFMLHFCVGNKHYLSTVNIIFAGVSAYAILPLQGINKHGEHQEGYFIFI